MINEPERWSDCQAFSGPQIIFTEVQRCAVCRRISGSPWQKEGGGGHMAVGIRKK